MNQMSTVPVESDRTNILFDALVQAVLNPEVEAGRMREMYSIYREIERDRGQAAYLRAKARVQAKLEPIVRNAVNDHIGNHYATLDAIVDGAAPLYTAEGFSMHFRTADPIEKGWVRVIGVCSYAPDGWPVPYAEESPLESPPDIDGAKGNANKTPIQARISTVTYLRKVLICLFFNIVMKHDPSDDDGEGGRRRRRRPETVDGEAVETPSDAAESRQEAGRRVKIWDWLDAFGRDLEGCKTVEEIEAVLGDDQVQRVGAWLAETANQKSAFARYKGHRQDAHKRIARMRAALPPPEQNFPVNLFDKPRAAAEHVGPSGWEGL